MERNLSNKDISLLQEAIVVLLRDKYAMPPNIKDLRSKYNYLNDLYDRLEDIRVHPVDLRHETDEIAEGHIKIKRTQISIGDDLDNYPSFT